MLHSLNHEMINCLKNKTTVSIEFCQEKLSIFGNLEKFVIQVSILFQSCHPKLQKKKKNLVKESLALVFMLVGFKLLQILLRGVQGQSNGVTKDKVY